MDQKKRIVKRQIECINDFNMIISMIVSIAALIGSVITVIAIIR